MFALNRALNCWPGSAEQKAVRRSWSSYTRCLHGAGSAHLKRPITDTIQVAPRTRIGARVLHVIGFNTPTPSR